MEKLAWSEWIILVMMPTNLHGFFIDGRWLLRYKYGDPYSWWNPETGGLTGATFRTVSGYSDWLPE